MLERRNGFRVSSERIEAQIQGIPVKVEDISTSGARLHLPKQLKTIKPVASCMISINYLNMTLPFMVIAEKAGDVRVQFFELEGDRRQMLHSALKGLLSA